MKQIRFTILRENIHVDKPVVNSVIFTKTIYFSPDTLVEIKNIFLLGIAWYHVDNSSLVELMQKMGKPSQNDTIVTVDSNESQILLRLIYENVLGNGRKLSSKF